MPVTEEATAAPPPPTDDPTATALRLIENGYSPLPIQRGTKACRVVGWSRWCSTTASPADVRAWSLDPDRFAGVGLAGGTTVVGVDIDVLDAGEADRLETLARKMLGDTPLRRVGRAPKRLLLYRAAEPAASLSRVGLDVIGTGRQLVAFAVHPGTGRPYEWGAGGSPLTVRAEALPTVTNAQVREFVEATGLEAIAAEDGGAGLQPVVHDPATGLVTDGREAWLTRCVLFAATHAPDAGVEAWTEEAWRHFTATTDLLGRAPGKNLTREATLRKCRYVAQRMLSGKIRPRQDALYTVEDFWTYLPQHSYIFVPARDHWPASSVDAVCTWPVPKEGGKRQRPTRWLDQNRAVEQTTWAPSLGEVVEDRLVNDGGWIERKGARVFNQYRPAPALKGGDAAAAGPWLELVERLYPEEHAHVVRWLAHRAQRPGEKINHGLVLGGAPGIGKDSLLAPVKHAVGYWNMREVSPGTLVEAFNGWAKSVVLRVSEARDLGGNELSAANRYSLYEHMKTLCAAPPETILVNEKHLRQYYVFNVIGMIITTNYQDGLYLPPDDRRFYVAWSPVERETIEEGYFDRLHAWYEAGGTAHVAAHLRGVDLSGFNPKATPPTTQAKRTMIDAGRDEGASPVGDALDKMRAAGLSVDAVTPRDLAAYSDDATLATMVDDPKSQKRLHRLLAECGYERVVNDANNGRWVVDGRRQSVYASRHLTQAGRTEAARRLATRPAAPKGDGPF